MEAQSMDEFDRANQSLHPEILEATMKLLQMMRVDRYRSVLTIAFEEFITSKSFTQMDKETRQDYASAYSMLNDFVNDLTVIETKKEERFDIIRKKYGIKTFEEREEERKSAAK